MQQEDEGRRRKFPLHSGLEVDRFSLYAARFNLHTDGDRGTTRKQSSSQRTAENL